MSLLSSTLFVSAAIACIVLLASCDSKVKVTTDHVEPVIDRRNLHIPLKRHTWNKTVDGLHQGEYFYMTIDVGTENIQSFNLIVDTESSGTLIPVSNENEQLSRCEEVYNGWACRDFITFKNLYDVFTCRLENVTVQYDYLALRSNKEESKTGIMGIAPGNQVSPALAVNSLNYSILGRHLDNRRISLWINSGPGPVDGLLILGSVGEHFYEAPTTIAIRTTDFSFTGINVTVLNNSIERARVKIVTRISGIEVPSSFFVKSQINKQMNVSCQDARKLPPIVIPLENGKELKLEAEYFVKEMPSNKSLCYLNIWPNTNLKDNEVLLGHDFLRKYVMSYELHMQRLSFSRAKRLDFAIVNPSIDQLIKQIHE